MNNSVTCPFCKLHQTFSSNLIDEFVCPNCHVGLRPNIDYEQIAPTSYKVMPQDDSTVTIGCKITFKNDTFVVIGKIRYQLNTTIILRWVLVNKDGLLNYLFEFINGYALVYKNLIAPEKQAIKNIKPTKKLSLSPYNSPFQVKAIYQNFSTVITGEIPLASIDFETFQGIELSNENNEFAFIQSSFDKTLTLYTGNFIAFDELLITSSEKENKEVVNIACSACKTPIINNLKGKVFSLVCSKCNSIFTFDKYQILTPKSKFKKPTNTDIPIESKGEIEGVNYTVIGILLKREEGTSYTWKEYNLRTDSGKIYTLSEFNGHYNLMEEIEYFDDTNTANSILNYNYKTYHLFNKYKIDLVSAEGAFAYEIINESPSKVSEFIAPPYIFIFERNKNEARFHYGRYILPKQIENAFKLAFIPEQIGTGATQTMFLGINYSIFTKICFAFLILLFVIQIFFAQTSTARRVYQEAFQQINMNDSNKVLVSSNFVITNAPTSLQFDLVSNVDNDWFGVTIELINNNTGDRFEVNKSIEFYNGIDGGESWSEGSKSESVFMSQVPAGTYHLNLYPEWGSANKETNNFEIWVYEDVTMWSNFWVILIVTAILVLIQYIRFRIFEGKRWMESNFDSPYVTHYE
jgi:hypothetical protein